MAQDYHIYIHGENGNGGGNNTQTFSARKEQGMSFPTGEVKQAFSTVKTMASGGALNTGVAALAKAVPWVAIAVAIVKGVDKVISTGFAHQEEYTGNYKNSMHYNNFKTIAGNVLNPIGYFRTTIQKEFQMKKQNKEIEQQNRLVGDAILKDFNMGI